MHLSEARTLLGQHRSVFIDSNLLVVYFVGCWSLEQVGTGRTTGFYPADARFLANEIIRSRSVIVTPHVLTEVDNLLDISLRGQALAYCRSVLASALAGDEALVNEHSPTTLSLTQSPPFGDLGLADSSIVVVAEAQRCLVVTMDRDLWDVLMRADHAVLNYRNIQPQVWGAET